MTGEGEGRCPIRAGLSSVCSLHGYTITPHISPGPHWPPEHQSASLGPQREQLDTREERGSRERGDHPGFISVLMSPAFQNITWQLANCCSSFRPKVLLTAPPRNTRSPAWSWWRWSSRSCSSSCWPSSSWSSCLGTAITRVTKCHSLGVIITMTRDTHIEWCRPSLNVYMNSVHP